MSITKYPPNTILLHGPTAVIVNDIPVSGVCTPGMLVERFSASGVPKYRKQVTAGAPVTLAVALNQPTLNKGVDDPYADGDLIEVAILGPGDTAWMLVPAAAVAIAAGDPLESAGGGFLALRTTGTPIARALYAVNNSAGGTSMRIKVEAI